MPRELWVWLGGEQVGRLLLAEGRLQFCYSQAWLAKPSAWALSHALPLQADPFAETVSRAVFGGLLPEGTVRLQLAQQLQVSRQNDFGLLARVGGDCAGAFSLLPASVEPLATPASVRWLDDTQLAEVLALLPLRPMLAGENDVRLSLAGAQDKLPVVCDGERIGLPLGAQPSTHIIKPAIAAVEDSVANEHFCLALAAAMGLPAAASRACEVQGQRFLLVSRYDRAPNQWAQCRRVHQEDLCQALGVPADMKYQNEGGPDLAACFALVRRATRPSVLNVTRLFDYVCFNALVGNHDAHGKNFSLLLGPLGWSLAPLYDVLSTAVYPALSTKMAMKIGSRYKFTELETRHWQQFATDAGLTWSMARKRVVEIAQRLAGVAHKLAQQTPHREHPLIERITPLIAQRCTLTLRRLSENATTQ